MDQPLNHPVLDHKKYHEIYLEDEDELQKELLDIVFKLLSFSLEIKMCFIINKDDDQIIKCFPENL